MSIPDVNLLLYAEFAHTREHARARSWWKATLEGEMGVGMATPVLFGFLRLATNPRMLRGR